MIRVLPFLLALALTVYAVVDCAQTPDDKVRGLPKIVWIMLIVLVWIVGPLAWFIAGRERGVPRAAPWQSPPAGPSDGGPSKRTLAPDDDPEFLRQLDRQRRRQRPDDPEGPTSPS
jgi:Phospholipase_D-nuclease N-terminal